MKYLFAALWLLASGSLLAQQQDPGTGSPTPGGSPVPEPGMAVLLIAGSVAGAFFISRKKK